MTTAQESTNGHCVLPPPSSVENAAETTSAAFPANQDNNQQFPASAYHVPPKAFTPSPHPRQPGEYAESAKRLGPLPDRCQFMFSDGRQCTMARSDIHPSLCVYHSDREEQLFGDPSSRFETRKLDFPELFSACRDLSTAAGVNRALAQVFRLLAQRRISRQEAATFGHLAKLLLRTISLMAADSTSVVIPSEYHERGIPQEVLPYDRPSATSPGDSSAPLPRTQVNPSVPPIAASPEPPAQRVAMSNSPKISTSAPHACNSPEISTSEIAGLNPIQNQHLDKRRSASEPCSSGRTASD